MRARLAVVPVVLLAALIGCGPPPATPTDDTQAKLKAMASALHNYSDPAAENALAKERLKQVGEGLHGYASNYGTFPAGVSAGGGVGLSWRVQLLPYLGGEELYKQFHLDESWDSEHNKTLIEKMPAAFASPGKTAPAGRTYIQAFRGPAAFLKTPPQTDNRKDGWNVPGRKMPNEFADGTANTLAVAEAAEPVIWTKPDDLDFDGKGVPKLGGVFADGFHGLMADGQVFFFPKDVTTDEMLRGLITINGKEVIDLNPIRKANGVKEIEYRKPTPLPNPDGPKPPVAKPPK